MDRIPNSQLRTLLRIARVQWIELLKMYCQSSVDRTLRLELDCQSSMDRTLRVVFSEFNGDRTLKMDCQSSVDRTLRIGLSELSG